MEARESVHRKELLEKLAWVLGIDWADIQNIQTLEFYKQGVHVSIGFTDKRFIPWKKERKGIGSVLAREGVVLTDPEFTDDQEMLL